MASLKLHLIYIVTAITAILPAKAQNLQATLRHYSTNDGLPNNAVADMKTDKLGYIWIATWNGLSRFDGANFVNYVTGSASGVPLMHNRITHLAIDSELNVWMLMYDGRIFVLRNGNNSIENPLKDVKGNENMKTNLRLTPLEKGNGIVAVIEGKGLYHMTLTQKGAMASLIMEDNKNSISAIDEDNNGSLWIGTDHGLYQTHMKKPQKPTLVVKECHVTSLNANNDVIYAGCHNGNIILVPTSSPTNNRIVYNAGRPIMSLFKDSHAQLWFATDEIGIKRLDVNTGVVKHYAQPISATREDALGAGVAEVDDRVWISMNKGGFGYYDREKVNIEFFQNDPSQSLALSNTVSAFVVLPGGVILESTNRKGVERLDIIDEIIKRTRPFGNSDDPSVNNVRALFYDKELQQLMVGGKSGRMAITKGNITTRAQGLGDNIGRIYNINKDSKGNYWIATKGNGLIKAILNSNGSFTYTSFRHNDDNRLSLSSDNVHCTVEDHDGNIWVATYDGGVNILTHAKDGRTVFLNHRNAMKHYPTQSFLKVRTIALDGKGNVWAGTSDGLLIMNLKQGKIRIERIDEKRGRELGLKSNDVICLACDKTGKMWIGTNGGGLSQCNGRDKNGRWLFTTYDSHDGTPSDEVKSITFDHDGNVWFATDHNIATLNTHKKIFVTFAEQEGVDATSLSEAAAVTLPSGVMLFGTTDGYYTVDRKEMMEGKKGTKLKLMITEIEYNLMKDRKNVTTHLFSNITPSTTVTLQRHSNNISVKFASLNFKAQAKVKYQYRLENFEEEWHNADATRTATYSDLPIGSYRFQVKAFMPESPETIEVQSFNVKVPQYYLLSRNAIWFYVLLTAAIIWGILKVRHNWLEKLAKMRVLKIGPQELAFEKEDDYNFVKRQLDWLEKHYSDSNLKIEDLAGQSGLSRTMYYNEIKSLTGLSPKEFLSDFRMKKARMMLEKTDLTVAEVAYNCGFNDPAYFSRIFKQETGQVPSKYRESPNSKTNDTNTHTQR